LLLFHSVLTHPSPPLLPNAERFSNLTGTVSTTNQDLLTRIDYAQSLNLLNTYTLLMCWGIVFLGHSMLYFTAPDILLKVLSFVFGAVYLLIWVLLAFFWWQRYRLAALRWDFDHSEREMVLVGDVYSNEYITRRADALWAEFANIKWYKWGSIHPPGEADIV
jgi:hypothetical protein